MDIVSLLKENWSVVSQAPWAFVTLAAVIGVGGFTIGRFFLSEKVSNLESRLTIRDERIKELEAKISTSTTDKAIDEDPTRHVLLGRLTAKYQDAHRDMISERMKAGLELPPAEWTNAELEKLEEPWRVRNIRGRNCEIFELPRYG
jgi:chaperonin cofactor prefoldin